MNRVEQATVILVVGILAGIVVGQFENHPDQSMFRRIDFSDPADLIVLGALITSGFWALRKEPQS